MTEFIHKHTVVLDGRKQCTAIAVDTGATWHACVSAQLWLILSVTTRWREHPFILLLTYSN